MREHRINLLGAPLDLLSMAQTVARAEVAMKTAQRLQLAVVNVVKFVHMRSDAELRQDVMESDMVNIDGIGVYWAARLLGHHPPGRVPGIDLMDALIALCAEKGYRPYFLGARQEVLDIAMTKFIDRYPDLQIAGSRDGYFSQAEEDRVVADIRNAGAHCLFVAISSPLKERFLHQHRDQLGVPFLMGIGSSLDVFAGKVQRAPVWVRQMEGEWLYRMCQEPRRMWRRYLVTNAIFFPLCWVNWCGHGSPA